MPEVLANATARELCPLEVDDLLDGHRNVLVQLSTSLSAVAASDPMAMSFGRSSGLTVSLSIWGISKCH